MSKQLANNRIPTIKACHREALKHGNEFLRYAVECGDELRAARKETLHGEWVEFLRICDLSLTTSKRYIAASKKVEESNSPRADLLGRAKSLRNLLDDEDTDNGKPQKPAAKPPPEPEDEIPAGLVEPVVEAVEAGKLEADPEQLEALAEYTDESQAKLAASVIEGRQTLDQAIETGEIPPIPIEDRIKAQNHAIESRCRQIKELVKEIGEHGGPWVTDYETTFDSAERQILNGIGTLRLMKALKACPECDGEGCEDCLDTGMVTRKWLDQR